MWHSRNHEPPGIGPFRLVVRRSAAFCFLTMIVALPGPRLLSAQESETSESPTALTFDLMAQLREREAKVRSFRVVWREEKRSYRAPSADGLLRKLHSAQSDSEKALVKTMMAVTQMEDAESSEIVELVMDGDRVRFAVSGPLSQDSSSDSREPTAWDHQEVFNGRRATRYLPNVRSGPIAELYKYNSVPGAEYVGARPIILTLRGATWATSRMEMHQFDPTILSDGMLDGHKVVVVGDPTDGSNHAHSVILWVDPEFGGRVLRYTLKLGGEISGQLDIVYGDDDVTGFIPESWTFAMFYGDGSPERVIQAKVLEFKVNSNISEDTFELTLAPGTIVSEDESTFRVADDGTMQPVTTTANPASAMNWRFIGINGAAVVAALLWFAHFLRTKEKSCELH